MAISGRQEMLVVQARLIFTMLEMWFISTEQTLTQALTLGASWGNLEVPLVIQILQLLQVILRLIKAAIFVSKLIQSPWMIGEPIASM